mmetsp:Transcript_7677/g.11028  ORF Transcript_7677/g.11028 Transcript_7677/m.11028 type:complete len:96 (-) Transcript_7677:502-789(-)
MLVTEEQSDVRAECILDRSLSTCRGLRPAGVSVPFVDLAFVFLEIILLLPSSAVREYEDILRCGVCGLLLFSYGVLLRAVFEEFSQFEVECCISG